MGFETGDNWAKSGGNKRGRPKAGKSIAEYARVKTKNGREIVDFYYKTFTDKALDYEIRLKAANRLEERAFGKAPQTITGQDEGPLIFQVVHQPPITEGQVLPTNGTGQNGAGPSSFEFYTGGSNGHGG